MTFYEWLGEYNIPQNAEVVSYPIHILSPFLFYHPYNYSLYYKFFLLTCIKISILYRC